MSATPHEIDTLPALKALIEALGGSYRYCASVFDATASNLCGSLRGRRPAPSVELLAKYAKHAKTEGVNMRILITPDDGLRYKIKIEG